MKVSIADAPSARSGDDEEPEDDGWPDEPELDDGPYDPVADAENVAHQLRIHQRWNYIQDLIQRQRLEEQWKPVEDQGSLAHQFKTVDMKTLFVVEDLFPDRTICQLNAQFKIGKTTLVTNLMQSLATGEPFLRRFPVHPKFKGHIAHWNLEVSQRTLLRWYKQQQMPEQALVKCFPLSVRGNLSLDFKNDVVVEWTIKWLQNNNIKVWIIDPLSKLFRDDENNNTAFNQWWLKLEHIANEAGVRLVVLVHHTGHSNQRGRGASAMMGNPDVLLNYTHAGDLGAIPPGRLRFLEAFGRDVDVPSTEVDFDADTNSLFCTNSGTTRLQAKSDTKARVAGVAVWDADDRLKTGDLYQLLGWRQDGTASKDNKAALERAVRKNFIVQTPNGRTVWYSRGTVDPRDATGDAK